MDFRIVSQAGCPNKGRLVDRLKVKLALPAVGMVLDEGSEPGAHAEDQGQLVELSEGDEKLIRRLGRAVALQWMVPCRVRSEAHAGTSVDGL
jgi:hypothetical protein